MKKPVTLTEIYKLAWPAMISHALIMLISIIDLAFIGRLGQATFAIAAAAIANNAAAAIYNFLEGLRTGTTVLIAQFFGAKNNASISKTIKFALVLACLIGCSLLFITPFFSKFLYSFIENKTIANLGNSYLTIRLLGLPFNLLIMAIIGIFRGLNNTFIPFTITMAVSALDILFNHICLCGKFGFPAMSINGVAAATATAYAGGALISILFLLKSKITKQYINFKASYQSIQKSFIKTGSEIGLYTGIIIVALFLFVFIFTKLGPQAIAAHQIAFQVYLTTYLPPMGFFVASSIIIGRLIGSKNYPSIVPTVKKIWLSSLPLIGGLTLLTVIFAPQIALFFSPQSKAVAQTATQSIYVICGIQIVNSLFLVLKGTLTAAKDTRFILIAGAITSYLFFLPLAYILGITLEHGVLGGYFAFLAWTTLDTIIFFIRFLRNKPWLLKF